MSLIDKAQLLEQLTVELGERRAYLDLFNPKVEDKLNDRNGVVRPEVFDAIERYAQRVEVKLAQEREMTKLLVPDYTEPFSARQVAVVAVLYELTPDEVLEIEARLSRAIRELSMKMPPEEDVPPVD